MTTTEHDTEPTPIEITLAGLDDDDQFRVGMRLERPSALLMTA